MGVSTDRGKYADLDGKTLSLLLVLVFFLIQNTHVLSMGLFERLELVWGGKKKILGTVHRTH